MPTLGELMGQFGEKAGEKVASQAVDPDAQFNAALESGLNKTASEGDAMGQMTLQDIYLQMSDMDKTAGQIADAPGAEPTAEEFAKVAEDLATAEAADVVAAGEEPQASSEDIVKIAAEYDSAGRIMARGFYDEFMKLAHGNKNTETNSIAKTPALGKRELATTPTNFAGSVNHTERMDTKGSRENYKDSLAPSKKITAGMTGDDPEAAAVSLGGGAPAGFATVRDLMG